MMDEITAMPLGGDILRCVDVLIAGRYVHAQRLARGLRGSAKQTVHLLTRRYRTDDIEAIPAAEVLIDSRGNISISGIDPPANPTGR